MAPLKNYLTGSLSNGGLLDDYELVGDNVSLTDSRDNYCGTDEDSEEFYEEWAINFVQTLNEEQN